METITIAVGQFVYRKGFDVLLNAWPMCENTDKLYIIGAEPTSEYIELSEKLNLNNVFFEGFKSKEKLKEYYQAADLFVLPTREDIWGLVINEAMANGLPVITTDHCVAGLELVKDGVNGYIVPINDVKTLGNRIYQILHNAEMRDKMAKASLELISDFTVQNMVNDHIKLFDEIINDNMRIEEH